MHSRVKSKYLVILLFSIIFYLPSLAAWLNYLPYTITQPDGKSYECYASGDEFHNWIHDEDGFTIILDEKTGYYVYAELIYDKLQPSKFTVGLDSPSLNGLRPWVNISAAAMREKRADFFKSYMPAKEPVAGFLKQGNEKNQGTLNNLVVYVRFNDQEEFQKDTMEYFNMFNQTDDGYNSMINYFKETSYEKLIIPSWFYPVSENEFVLSYQDIYGRGYFKPYSSSNPDGYQDGERSYREQSLLKRALNYIKDDVPQNIDIDYNNDGYVDNVVFIIKGGTTAWSTLLWPHRWSLYYEEVYINGKRVWDYNFQLESSLKSSGAGVLCHEMFHSLGAPDLYHYNNYPIDAVGKWDIMEQNTNPPQSMGAYMKYRYGGWIDNIPEITDCGYYQLNPVSHPTNNCYKIKSPNSATEYFIIEYRKKEGTFESSIPGSGLLIYRINTMKDGDGNAGGPPDEVYIYRPSGTIDNNGALQYANFGADYDRIEFHNDSDPACFLSNSLPGGLNIKNIGFVDDSISFEVRFEAVPEADFETSLSTITPGCSIDFTDRTVCGSNSWLWTFEGGMPSTSSEQHPQGIVYENSGNFDVTLSVSNDFGDDVITKYDVVQVSNTILPEVFFEASDIRVCTGRTISFKDESVNCPIAWKWGITPGTIEYTEGTTDSSANPVVIFNQKGFYSVSLTVYNVNGENTVDYENYIFAGGDSFPFYEDFETSNLKQMGWTVTNPDNNKTWEIVKTEEPNENFAASMNFYNYKKAYPRDQLITPSIDLSDTDVAYLLFKHSYALWSYPKYSDSLIVKISTDCGESWTRLLSLSEDGSGNFVTHSPFDYNYFPDGPEDWCTHGNNSNCNQIDVSSWTGNQNVKIMFESVRLAGNNLYIDDVSISDDWQSIESEKYVKPFIVYPNPANNWINIEFQDEIKDGALKFYNSSGSIIMERNINNNEKIVSFDLTQFSSGIYFIKITGSDFFASEKVLIK